MPAPNPIQAISQQRQQFATPPPVQRWPQPPEQPRPMDDLAEEIYVRLVTSQHQRSQLDESHLRQLARDARTAARIYFEPEI